MEPQKLQLEILSAQNPKNVNTFGKMTVYAVAWVSPNIKVSTTIDPNTTWHPLCILTVQKWILQQRNANLQIDISSPGIFSNNHVASCSVPLSHFQEMDSPGADAVKAISFLVCGPSGQAEWTLNLSLKLGDVYQPSAMPGPSSAVAQTVEPNNNHPILAYSAGYPNQYNQAGGSLYPQYPPQYAPQYPPQYTPQYPPQYTPQYPPQYPQSYPPVIGPPPPYYPPPGPYAVSPPPRRTGLFGVLSQALGGLGTMEGLLSGAGDTFLIGQTLFGGSGGGGQAPLDGSGGSGFGGGLGDGGFAGSGYGGTSCGAGGLGP